MKIAQFIDTDIPGGAEVVILNLCLGLRERGHDVVILHFGHPWLESKCDEYSIDNSILPAKKYYKSVKTLPIFALKFSRVLKQEEIEVLHSHLYGPVTAGALAAFLARITHVGTLHDVYSIIEMESRSILLKLSNLLGTKLVTVSADMKSTYDDICKFRDGVITKIFNGVDLNKRDSSVINRNEIGLKREDIVFISVGRLVPLKRHIDLIEAFNKFNYMNEFNAALVIVGDGIERENIEKYLNKNPSSQIKMLGFSNNVAGLLHLSDCFVLVSETEGLSCSIQEAMRESLPIIATDVGGNRELVLDDINGFLVRVYDVDSIADAMFKIANNIKIRKRFSTESRYIIEKEFSLKNMVDNYESLYLGDSSE